MGRIVAPLAVIALLAVAGCSSNGDVRVDDRSISARDSRPDTRTPVTPRTGDDPRVTRRDGDVEITPIDDGAGASSRVETIDDRASAAPRGTRPAPIRSRAADPRDLERYDSRASAAAPSSPGDARAAEAPPSRPPAVYVVAPGDTLYGIAFRNGLDFRVLAAWNDVPAPYTIKTGQRLVLAPPGAGAPIASSPPIASPPPGGVATVPSARPLESPPPDTTPPSGSTPAPVRDRALPPGVEELTDAPVAPRDPSVGGPLTNAPAPPASSASTTPSMNTARPSAPGGAVSAAIAGRTAPPAAPAPPPPVATTPAATTPAPPASSTLAAGTMIDTGPSQSVSGIRWRWPARGSVITRFTAGDAARQGIDVLGSVGQAVAAAADGEVVYSGNGLLGYGELIIIKHSPEFLSAYGYNRRRLVKEGDRVKAGQAIAEMGQNGAAQSIVHFEIRQAGRPVDPLRFLPRR